MRDLVVKQLIKNSVDVWTEKNIFTVELNFKFNNQDSYIYKYIEIVRMNYNFINKGGQV